MMNQKQPVMICTICARGGSKGVPGKNIRDLMGKPLLAHSIEQARASGLFNVIAVSSDCDKILKVALDFGADYAIKRPDELASDNAGKLPAILHALDQAEQKAGLRADFLFDLDATSPLRSVKDILACAQTLVQTKASNIITGTPSHRSPYFNLVERTPTGSVCLSKTLPKPVLRRQDSPECFDMNASIYGWRRDVLEQDPKVFYPDTQIHVMPRDRSLDIDEELDFMLVEMIMQRRAKNEPV